MVVSINTVRPARLFAGEKRNAMSLSIQNADLLDYLASENASEAQIAQAIETVADYAPGVAVDPFAASLVFGSRRFTLRHKRRAGLVIPVETAGVLPCADGTWQLAVRCNVPGKLRVNGKLVSRVVVPVGDLIESTARRHTHNPDGSRVRFAIPCANGEASWAGDARSDRQIEKNDKRAAAASGDDTAAETTEAVQPYGFEDCGIDADTGDQVFRATFNPAAGLGSGSGVELPEFGDLADAAAWAEIKNSEAAAAVAARN